MDRVTTTEEEVLATHEASGCLSVGIVAWLSPHLQRTRNGFPVSGGGTHAAINRP